jgi:hypothetical protein
MTKQDLQLTISFLKTILQMLRENKKDEVEELIEHLIDNLI